MKNINLRDFNEPDTMEMESPDNLIANRVQELLDETGTRYELGEKNEKIIEDVTFIVVDLTNPDDDDDYYTLYIEI